MRLSTLTRWDPYRNVVSLQDQVDRFFGDSPLRFVRGDGAGAWTPSVDLSEEGDRIILRAEVPGVAREDIEVQVERGTITLRGEKKQEKNVESENAHLVERFYGSFSRSFVLPTTIDPARIEANYKNGVLEVILPKADEAKPKKITIN